MGVVDYLSRHPSGKPVPVSLDDEKFFIASVNQISTLLGFDHLMPKKSWSQIRNKFSQHFLAHDVTHCNTIGQSTDHMTCQEIEREKRIANAAETFQAIVNYSLAKILTRERKIVTHPAKSTTFLQTSKY